MMRVATLFHTSSDCNAAFAYLPAGTVSGSPVAIQVLKDGSMLLADDGANLIYRITYSKP